MTPAVFDKWTRLSLIGLALILTATTGFAFAQDGDAQWPTRPVHFIVPFPAGSATDTIARIVAQKLGSELGQPFVIDNRAGASGEIHCWCMKQSFPDSALPGSDRQACLCQACVQRLASIG